MWKWLWGIISTVAAVFVFLSKNKAGEAVSNLASWWELIGKTTAPAWLQTAFAGGSLVGLGVSALVLLRPWRLLQHQLSQETPSSIASTQEEWISLTEAARQAYGKTRGGFYSMMADRFESAVIH